MENRAVSEADMEIDLRALFSTLLRKLPFIVVFVALVAVGAFFGLKALPPSFTSEVSIFIDGGDGNLTDATQSSPEQTLTGLDEQAITSQVQLVRSRDLARSVAQKLDLASKPEFNPALRSASFLDTVLTAVGLDTKPTGSVEDQVLKAYYKKLSVYAVDRSRVIVIDFQSRDPELAAAVANAIAEGYIVLQREAKRDATANAAKFLDDQIGELRVKVQDAEAKVEDFRSKNDLFSSGGSGDSTLPQQQLGDLNAELSKVQAEIADAKARADQIRAALKAGSISNLPEVQNSPLIQRLVEQQ
ncbi:MAG: GumC family protein, partial [Hyphomicrobiaceae bacterium]|nr:GumC family protein [Hyphomicrobiaceae bacterium]